MNENDERHVTDDRLGHDDVLAQAIAQLPEMRPTRELWSGIHARIAQPTTLRAVARTRSVSMSWSQLALAASLLMAVTVSLTWLVARQPFDSVDTPSGVVNLAQDKPGVIVVRAESEPMGSSTGDIMKANFADAQYDAAVADLEKILQDERDRLDPRTVIIIERNLQTIDQAIREAREALDRDPANTYLNSHLADARRRKLELLRHATALASTGGD
jgi:tetratricopeptide (TPR) repeat protein